MAGLYTGAIGLWGGLPGLISSTTLSTPPSLLANVGGIAATGANLALWFDTNQAYKSSGGGIVTPDSILTYTAPSPKLVYGSDGVLRYAPHNLLLQSQAFDNASWIKLNASVAGASINAAVAPDGTLTADKLVENSSSGFHTLNQTGGTVGAVETYSVYAKADGRNWIKLQPGSFQQAFFDVSNGVLGAVTDAVASISSAGNGWYRCSITVTRAGNTNNQIQMASANNTASYTGDGVSGVYLWGAQLNRGPSALTYVPTTTAAVYSLPRDYNPTTGVALGVLAEEARTNLCLYSDDFTNAAWVKSNLTTAKTATGPDGAANSASTLTATLANGTVLQTITSASASRVTSMFVKRRTGTGAIEMTQDNGVLWTAVTVTANWTRVSVPSATILNPIVGVRIVTSGDAIDVALFQNENGGFITSPIPTQASQVTRAADQISILTSAFPYSATESTLAVEYRAPLALAQDIVWIANGLAESLGLYTNGSSGVLLWCRDGGVTQAATTIQIMTGEMNKVAAAYKLNDFSGSLNGAAVAVDTVGTMPTPTELKLNPRGISGVNGNIHIKRLAYYASRKSNAELQVLST